MLRRVFLQLCGTFLGATVPTKLEEGPHYFDWSGYSPHTTDPEYVGKLTYGLHNLVVCDGVEILYAIRFVTGRKGWVEYQKMASKNTPLLDFKNGNTVKGIILGYVEYTDKGDLERETLNARS